MTDRPRRCCAHTRATAAHCGVTVTFERECVLPFALRLSQGLEWESGGGEGGEEREGRWERRREEKQNHKKASSWF